MVSILRSLSVPACLIGHAALAYCYRNHPELWPWYGLILLGEVVRHLPLRLDQKDSVPAEVSDQAG